jgi:ribosomal protein S18 acetylase RimI-like enzyme
MSSALKILPEFSLRPAGPGDDEFALGLYLPITREFLCDIPGWDDARIIERFRKTYDPVQVQVICVNGTDVGWMQLSELDEGLHLDQLHLVEAYRGRGIGTRLMKDLQSQAQSRDLPFRLNVMRANSAIEFYRGLGFAVVGEDNEKYQMQWMQRKKDD